MARALHSRPRSPLAVWVPVLSVVMVASWPGASLSQWGHGGWGSQGGGGWVSWASTAQQGADMGMAEVIRSEGYRNLQNSEAAKNWEEAKTLEIQNRLRWTETYFEMRKVNREARAAEKAKTPPLTQEQAIRIAKASLPPRLSSTQLDPVTGHIEYPIVLRDSVFKPYRDHLDRLFADRAATGGSIQYDQYREIQQTVSKFIEVLKEHVDDYAAGEYGRARTFLDSIAHESRLPAG